MSVPLYEGCWHKLDRAKQHFDELDGRVGAWTNLHPEPPYTFGKQFNRKRNVFTFHIEDIRQFPFEWSLITGDVLTNFRAALDFLAYDLVGQGETPHRRHEIRTFFPIAEKKGNFKGQVNGGMPGISRKQRAIIEAYQPYKWSGARKRHPFALLNTLVNRDKHRELQPVYVRNYGPFRAFVVSVNHFEIHRVLPVIALRSRVPARFEPGTKVGRVYGKKTGPNPNVEMGFIFGASIAFEDAPAWFPDALEGIGQAITKLFREIEPTL